MSEQSSIYLHIPFCVKKCSYCDFYSRTCLSRIPDYIRHLQQEIKTRSGSKEEIATIYFGGGTPSLAPVKAVETLLQTIGDHFFVSRDVEVTLEVNPGTVDSVYLGELKGAGINRLSMGVQSFDDDKLAFLGRIHTADQARQAMADAQNAGFDNISMDLIYGVPSETRGTWTKDLDEAVRIAPSHLSCYMLTIEPGTRLDAEVKKKRITPLGNTAMSRLFKMTSQFLSEFNYDHYEISNFSRGRKNRSRHNSKYWDLTPYYGFGAAAHSYDGNTRSWNHRRIDAYMKDLDSGRLPVEDRETLSLEQKMVEMIMLRLRTLEGLDLKKFQALFHKAFESQFKALVTQIRNACLGEIKNGRFALTLEGRMRLNSIVEAFAEKIL